MPNNVNLKSLHNLAFIYNSTIEFVLINEIRYTDVMISLFLHKTI